MIFNLNIKYKTFENSNLDNLIKDEFDCQIDVSLFKDLDSQKSRWNMKLAYVGDTNIYETIPIQIHESNSDIKYLNYSHTYSAIKNNLYVRDSSRKMVRFCNLILFHNNLILAGFAVPPYKVKNEVGGCYLWRFD